MREKQRNQHMRVILAALLSAIALESQSTRNVVLVGTLQATNATLTAIPSAGADITQWTHANVFELSSSAVTDWTMYVSTQNDTRESGIYQQQIDLRKTAAAAQISTLSYTGVTGAAEDRIGINSYTHFSPADNNRASIDYSGPYYSLIGNGQHYARPLESSSYVAKCAPLGALIPNCSETVTITPQAATPTNAYVWVRSEALSASLTITGAGYSQTIALPAGSPNYEGVVTIPLAPPAAGTAYTVQLQATAPIGSGTNGYLGILRAKLGGADAGNVPDVTLATRISAFPPTGTTGARTLQPDPPSRIPAASTSIALTAGNDLQAAVNMAAPGTDIHLPLGYVWTGNLQIPNHTGTGWVRVIADGAPAATFGRRANPIDYPGGSTSPAQIVSPNQNAAIYTAAAAHHFAAVGMEIYSTVADTNYALIGWGAPSPIPLDGSTQPHDLILSGVYVHGNLTTRPAQTQVFGMEGDADAWGVYDSYFTGFENRAGGVNNNKQDNRCINVITSHGPITIKNNYFNSASEDVIFGGTQPLPAMDPRDIEITGNEFDRDLYLNTPDAQGNFPYPLTVKNGLELKIGQYVTVSKNVFKNMFAGQFYANGQNGQAVFLRFVDAQNPTGNVLVENNIIRDCGTAFSVESQGPGQFGGGSPGTIEGTSLVPIHYIFENSDVTIRNNLILNLSVTKTHQLERNWQSANVLSMEAPPINFTFGNNTATFDFAADWNTLQTNSVAGRERFFSNGGSAITASENALITQRYGSIGFSQFADNAANASWIMQNNVLAGSVDGGGALGGLVFPSTMTYTHNIQYGSVPQYLTNRLLAPLLPPNITGDASNTFTGNINFPTTIPAGVGVNYATLPNECAVHTGNRSDIACTLASLAYIDVYNDRPTWTVAQGNASQAFNLIASPVDLETIITPTLTGLPTGATVTFSPATLPIMGGTTVATVSITSSTARGTYSLSFVFTSGGASGTTTNSTPATLTIQ